MFKHTASKINDANYCERKYFLKHVLRREGIIPSSFRRGSLMHKLAENFWGKLGRADEIRRDKNGKIISEKKYSNAEEFVEYAQRQWMHMLRQDEEAKREISWAFEGEMWYIKNKYLPEHCEPLFQALTKEEPPIGSEINFDFILNNRRFSGRIDEIRLRNGKVVIRDYKTERPWMEGMKLSGNPQLTLYCVGLCALCYGDEEFAEKLGLQAERKSFLGNPRYTSEKVKPEFFMMSALPIINKPEQEKKEWEKNLKVVYETERTDRDFFELLRSVKGLEHKVQDFLSGKEKDIPPTNRGRKCDDCDMEIACLNELGKELKAESQKVLKDESGQTYFNYASPYFVKPIKRRKKGQTRFRWKPGWTKK